MLSFLSTFKTGSSCTTQPSITSFFCVQEVQTALPHHSHHANGECCLSSPQKHLLLPWHHQSTSSSISMPLVWRCLETRAVTSNALRNIHAVIMVSYLTGASTCLLTLTHTASFIVSSFSLLLVLLYAFCDLFVFIRPMKSACSGFLNRPKTFLKSFANRRISPIGWSHLFPWLSSPGAYVCIIFKWKLLHRLTITKLMHSPQWLL